MPALNPGDPGYKGRRDGWNPNNWTPSTPAPRAVAAAQPVRLENGKMPYVMGGAAEDYRFESQLGPDGKIRSGLQLGNRLNTDYLTGLRENALRDPGTPSAWRGLQQQKINLQAGDVNVNMANQQQRQLDQMAMRGGVSAGAGERMAQQGVGQALRAQQNVYGQGLQADMADEQNRLTGLQNLGQAELGAAQFGQDVDKTNLQMTMSELQQKRLYEAKKYQEQMNAWAAKNTAQAAPSSGGGGLSVICTALYSLGYINQKQYDLNTEWGKKIPVDIFVGYLTWASPLAARMFNSPRFAKLMALIFKTVSNEMAAIESKEFSSTLSGKIGLKLCIGASIVAGSCRVIKRKIEKRIKLLGA